MNVQATTTDSHQVRMSVYSSQCQSRVSHIKEISGKLLGPPK